MSEAPRINPRFQDQHLPDGAGSGVDWVALQLVERDICLLYHQLSDYAYLMGDLYWGSVYALPYWEFVAVEGLPEEEGRFVAEGCLVIILTMLSEVTDATGYYVVEHLDECARGVAAFEPADENAARLKRVAQRHVELVREEKDVSNALEEVRELYAEHEWVHETYVKGYFRRVVHDFDHHPYFNRPGP